MSEDKNKYAIGWFATKEHYLWNGERITHIIIDKNKYPIIKLTDCYNKIILSISSRCFDTTNYYWAGDSGIQKSFSSLSEAKLYAENLLKDFGYKVLDKEIMCFDG